MDKNTGKERRKILDTPDEGTESGTSSSATLATKLRGILALFTAAFLATTSRVSVQALNNVIPDFQLNAMRSATALVCIQKRNINSMLNFKLQFLFYLCNILL